MIKILFLIRDLGPGGAQKVLIDLVNNMDRHKFDISVTALFGGGVNEQFLAPHIHYRTVWNRSIPGSSKLMKILSPQQLHSLCVKEKYDIEISYLEGPPARIISGCPQKDIKLVSWIHVQQNNLRTLKRSFRNAKEAHKCYNRFDQTVCVSEYVKQDFCGLLEFKKPCKVLYNTVESHKILQLSKESAKEILHGRGLNMIAVGTLKESKGYDRLLHIMKRLKEENRQAHLYILGIGHLEEWIRSYIADNALSDFVTLLGYQTNPYKYVEKCDLFVCASHAEGFSTAATEALIVGTPVCTVEVSGMKEMLGENNEYGIVTDSTEEALYMGIRKFLDDPEILRYYAQQATLRGKYFSTEETVSAVESMLEHLTGDCI